LKILFYNWTHIDENIGGGVNVYQKQLALSLIKRGYKVYYLNSGLTYDDSNELKIVRYDNKLDDNIITYEIVNSPVIAPVRQSIINLEKYLYDKSLSKLIAEFIREINPNIIHFNNIEGLSLSVIGLKKEFNHIRFIYSLHNYFPFCSRVDLWKHTKNGDFNCESHTPNECLCCYDSLNYNDEIYIRKKESTFQLRILKKYLKQKDRLFRDKRDVTLFDKFTSETLKAINEFMDEMLAVSERVAEIYINNGVNKNKVRIMYIGTKVAENQVDFSNADIHALPFGLLYMGYMSKVKGFYSFLDSVEQIPDSISSKIHLRIVAKYGVRQINTLRRIKKLEHKFSSVELVNGYTLQTQKRLLENMHLGVVPVLWEDNLPQVAIEQIANGVPIITSNLGGAKELFDKDARFVFEAGNVDQLTKCIIKIFNNRLLLKEFWKKKRHFPTFDEHISDLERIYY
jgi:glycosyltransferase involved in cell wall biosynthesis